MEGTPPWAPSHVGLRSPGRKVNAESLCVPSDQPEKEREGEGERKKEREKKRKTWGDQASSVREAPYFIFKRDFYTLTCT